MITFVITYVIGYFIMAAIMIYNYRKELSFDNKVDWSIVEIICLISLGSWLILIVAIICYLCVWLCDRNDI